ncbi:MAG: hypothetical protein IJU81_07785 [Bacteroidales bacterium]|nr:hypothetical protein [Bacteroidales bacterium]
MKKHIFMIAGVLALLAAVSCKKDDPEPEIATPQAYVLCEGSWGGNNATLDAVNLDEGTIKQGFFSEANGRGLGDLACDVVRYGSKLYVTVSESNKIEVVDPATGKSTKQIDMGDLYPRYIAPHNGQLYVSCYNPHSVVRIDTATLTIAQTCQLGGNNPEQLCVAGGNIYVCSGYIADAEGNYYYDSTLRVVRLANFTETGSITVGSNPKMVKVLDGTKIVVNCLGDYGANPAKTVVVNTTDNSVTALPVALTVFDVYNSNTIYGYATEYDENWTPVAKFYRVDIATALSEEMLQSHASSLSAAYCLNVDPQKNLLFIGTGVYGANGDIFCFDLRGNKKWQAETGLYPCKTVF